MKKVIKNGKTIDGRSIDIAIEHGKIREVSSKIKVMESAEIVDLKHKSYVSAGWIDDHVHCYEKMDLYYDTPDKIGVEKGVTSVIDAGSTGADNLPIFQKLSQSVKTNVYALLNISKTGIIAQNELENMNNIDLNLIEQRIKKYPNFIVGLKARMSKSVVGPNEIQPLKQIQPIREKLPQLPLMVHIGSAPPKLSQVLGYLKRGDVLTHCFNGKLNGIVEPSTMNVRKEAWNAYNNGVIFDIGHGTDSFNFDVAKAAYDEGMFSRSISTDIYHRNRESGPVYDLATTMEKMHVTGYSWEMIIQQVTETPAKTFRLNSKGRIEEGKDADLTIFDIVPSEKKLVDSNGNTRIAKEEIIPRAVIIGGEFYDI